MKKNIATSTLTKNQLLYLSKIDPTTTITILPFDSRAKDEGLFLVQTIKTKTGLIAVFLIGSLMLEISGSNDIDVMCFCEKDDFPAMKQKLSQLYVDAKFSDRGRYLQWSTVKTKSYQATIYLNDIRDENAWQHVRFTQILDVDHRLISQYENAKNENMELNGEVNYKAYMKRKYHFINQVLKGKS